MRIAMVSEHASPLAVLGGADAGGQNVHVDSLARALARRGHEVIVHTRRDDPDLPVHVAIAPGVTVHHVDAGPPRPIPKDELLPHLPAFTSELAAHWSRRRPELVHAHFWMSGVASAPAAASLTIPLTITFHALGSVKRRHQGAADTSPPARVDAERALLHHVDRVIATAHEEVLELRLLGAPEGRIDVVPCGVDTAAFRPEDRPAPFPADDGDGRPFRVLSLGRLVPRKGVDDAIAMLPMLPGCELVIAGGPSPDALDDDPEVRRLRGLAGELGVAGRVHLVGAVPRDEVPDLIRSADVVVCLPWYEPFGIVPLEAMACGRPVVGSGVGGLCDSIDHGRTGLLVPPRSPAAAAAAVRHLMSAPEQRLLMGQDARRRVEEQFDWAMVAMATERVYSRVIAERRTRALAARVPQQAVRASARAAR